MTTLPTPPQTAAASRADAFLFHAGAGDVFEITTATVALQRSRDPGVRAFASMLTDHHARLTNGALTAARSAGVMAPPPELSPAQKANVAQLMAAPAPGFDRLFLSQQRTAHQQALALMQGYAARGDTPALRAAAQAAVPTVQDHLRQVDQLDGARR